MSIRKRLKSGFTLVELMIVVAIIGILAVLAVYGVKKYMANAKTAEARQALGRLGKDAGSAYEGEHMIGTILPEGSVTAVTRQLCNSAVPASVPGAIAQVKAQKYQSTAAEWKIGAATLTTLATGWACLRFELNTPQYYMYSYTAANFDQPTASFKADANGDLDGNGTSSQFELTGAVENARLKLAPTLTEVDPEE